MHRATALNIAFRAFTAGGARSVVGAADDSKLMQEMGGNFMSGESRQRIESPQNYGFTSVVMDADMGSDGSISGGAETFISFMGGGRSSPIATVMDDRRHRLKDLAKGDVAMFRTATDQLQFHLAQTGGYMTAPNNKKLRMALVAPDQQQQGVGTHADGGSTSGTGAGGQQQQKKGQQAQYQKDSTQYHEVNGTMTQSVNKQHQITLTDKKTGVEVNPDQNVYLGGIKSSGTFLPVMLSDGTPASNVYGRKSGGMAALVEISADIEIVAAARAKVAAALAPLGITLADLAIALGL